MTDAQSDYLLTSDYNPDFSDLLQGVILEHLQKEDEAIEAAISQGSLYGNCGATVIRDGLTTTVRVDARVPQQNVFHFPSPEAYDAWVALRPD